MLVKSMEVTLVRSTRRGHDGGNPLPAPELCPAHAKHRSDGRPHDTGLVRPYRPCPADFRDRFLELGYSKEIEEHYRTNWRVIARWIEEAGGEALRAERFKVAGARTGGKLRSRASRYVLGRTLTVKA